MQPLIPIIIGEEQNAFTKGRLIAENIILNHEIIQFLKKQQNGGKRGMAFKLDISKAYDCVEWSFWKYAKMPEIS